MTTPAFVLGIDAGGTSLRAALAPVGEAIRFVAVPSCECPAAPDGGPEPLLRLLPDLLARNGVPTQNVAAACAGITKITRGDTAARWAKMLSDLLPTARVQVVPDYEIAFHGAVADGTGIAVIAGTGSVAYGKAGSGLSVRVGGRGWEFGDEGSGAWLTTEMVRRTLRALDGLENHSAITRAVCELLGTNDPAQLGEQARQRIVEQGRGFLVPHLLERARGGDEEARKLYVGAGGWFAALARAALQRLSLSPEDAPVVAMVGGLWQARDLLTEPFARVLHRWYPAARIQEPDATPLVGSLALAMKLTRTFPQTAD